MQQMARNATGESWGFLGQRRYVLHDRDTKFCSIFRATLKAGAIKPIQLPARSPNLNAYAERWVRSAKEECLADLRSRGFTSSQSTSSRRPKSYRKNLESLYAGAAASGTNLQQRPFRVPVVHTTFVLIRADCLESLGNGDPVPGSLVMILTSFGCTACDVFVATASID
jgi:hypothetical protein